MANSIVVNDKVVWRKIQLGWQRQKLIDQNAMSKGQKYNFSYAKFVCSSPNVLVKGDWPLENHHVTSSAVLSMNLKMKINISQCQSLVKLTLIPQWEACQPVFSIGFQQLQKNTGSTSGFRCNLWRPAVLPWLVQMVNDVGSNYCTKKCLGVIGRPQGQYVRLSPLGVREFEPRTASFSTDETTVEAGGVTDVTLPGASGFWYR